MDSFVERIYRQVFIGEEIDCAYLSFEDCVFVNCSFRGNAEIPGRLYNCFVIRTDELEDDG